MSTYGEKHGDETAPTQADVARRTVLIGSGGLLLAVAVAVGWPSGGFAGDSLGQAPRRVAPSRVRHAARITTTAKRPREHAKPARPREHRKPARLTRADRGAIPAEPVYYLDDGPKVIALTIDDGPSPVYTPQILRILERYRVTASFSMIGESVAYYPGIARDVADAGHLIVNHTWDHADLARLGAAATRAEISRASDAVHGATGRRPGMFRAPYGVWTRTALECCASEGLTPLGWSVDPRDWSRPGVREIVANIMRNTGTGSIILEHDGGGDRSQTVVALRTVIPRLLDEGYRFAIP
jgi:peptidoglycan/xylan/chitin deacetylase (PgdA/CDA1 family)